MDPKVQRRAIVIASLLAMTAIILALQKAPASYDETGVRLELPETVGDYAGTTCLFCQNQLCERSLVAINDNGEKVCHLCKSQLSTMSVAEKTLLPPDTLVIKKRYKDDKGEVIFAMIVATGKERRSIHRPETCLPAQGNSIEGSRILPVDIPARDPLKVMLLDLRSSKSSLADTGQDRFSAYAYWFVSPACETPYHLERMIRMSIDRAFYGVSYRWAYIAVSSNRQDGSDDYIRRISRFIADLYPQISAERNTSRSKSPETTRNHEDL